MLAAWPRNQRADSHWCFDGAAARVAKLARSDRASSVIAREVHEGSRWFIPNPFQDFRALPSLACSDFARFAVLAVTGVIWCDLMVLISALFSDPSLAGTFPQQLLIRTKDLRVTLNRVDLLYEYRDQDCTKTPPTCTVVQTNKRFYEFSRLYITIRKTAGKTTFFLQFYLNWTLFNAI